MEMTEAEGPRDRVEGIRALAVLGSTSGLPSVVACLEDPEGWVREEAVIALLQMGSSEAIPALESVRDDPERNVRLYAEEVLKRLR